jgi:hypothetical protein
VIEPSFVRWPRSRFGSMSRRCLYTAVLAAIDTGIALLVVGGARRRVAPPRLLCNALATFASSASCSKRPGPAACGCLWSASSPPRPSRRRRLRFFRTSTRAADGPWTRGRVTSWPARQGGTNGKRAGRKPSKPPPDADSARRLARFSRSGGCPRHSSPAYLRWPILDCRNARPRLNSATSPRARAARASVARAARSG